ncbi:hypothetical protein BH11PLA2_BH11PLA2_28020 [soil metagenome]
MPEVEIPDPHETHEKAADPFTKRIALCVAIYAVILAVAAAGGNNCGKDMLMEQLAATSQWGLYQGKSIREANYLNDKERYEYELTKDGLSAESKTQISKSLARINAKLEEYKKEKAEIMEVARKHEHERDDNRKRDPYFDYSEVVMQIAIVLASVAMLSGRRWAFYLSIVLALIGMALMLNGFLLFDGGKLLAGGHH